MTGEGIQQCYGLGRWRSWLTRIAIHWGGASSVPNGAEAAISERSSARQISSPNPMLCAITDLGRLRESNEDAFRISADHGVLLVADGMGGELGGEVASLIAADIFMELNGDDLRGGTLLRAGFDEAQRRVLHRAKCDPGCAGMGAALVVAALEGNYLRFGHAGDARAYVSREGVLTRLTTDHSAVARFVLNGDLSWEEARLHPARSTLVNAVGFDGSFKPEFGSVELRSGDRVLLCSDGLWDELPDSEINDVLASEGNIRHLSLILLNRALAAGGRDNITLIMYEHACPKGEAA